VSDATKYRIVEAKNQEVSPAPDATFDTLEEANKEIGRLAEESGWQPGELIAVQVERE
jgi:hypothetical protein